MFSGKRQESEKDVVTWCVCTEVEVRAEFWVGYRQGQDEKKAVIKNQTG